MNEMNSQTKTIINTIENIEGHNTSHFDTYLMLFDVPEEAIPTREGLIAHIGATLEYVATNIIEQEFEGCEIEGVAWEDVAVNLYDIDALWARYGTEAEEDETPAPAPRRVFTESRPRFSKAQEGYSQKLSRQIRDILFNQFNEDYSAHYFHKNFTIDQKLEMLDELREGRGFDVK